VTAAKDSTIWQLVVPVFAAFVGSFSGWYVLTIRHDEKISVLQSEVEQLNDDRRELMVDVVVLRTEIARLSAQVDNLREGHK
jgi:hypothetical protein